MLDIGIVVLLFFHLGYIIAIALSPACSLQKGHAVLGIENIALLHMWCTNTIPVGCHSRVQHNTSIPVVY